MPQINSHADAVAAARKIAERIKKDGYSYGDASLLVPYLRAVVDHVYAPVKAVPASRSRRKDQK